MMKSRVKRTLIIGALGVLNLALGVAVYLRSTDSTAYGQMAIHTMDVQAITGRAGTGNIPASIFMFDAVSGQLVAMRPTLGGNNLFITSQADVFRAMNRMR
jgi:hypothetical protein